MDFGIALQDPLIQGLLQQNILQRAFHDALYPRLMFRGEATVVQWPQNVGESMVFTAVGLIKKKLRPIAPNQDPVPSSYPKEQWKAQIQKYVDTIDTNMPTNVTALAALFLTNTQQLGLSAAESLNALTRNRSYNAGTSGHTVADGAQVGVTTLRVKRLNGFTKARRPDVVGASVIGFDTVTGSNPLPITVYSSGAPASVNVIGYTPDTVGDEIGPGTLALSGAVTVLDRAYVISYDRSYVVRVGGGFKTDDIGAGDLLRMSNMRSAIARFWNVNAPEQPDGRFHCHLDPSSIGQIYDDPEWQRLHTALPDHYAYREFAIEDILGTVFYRDNQCPQIENVEPKDGVTFSQDDPIAGELYSDGTANGTKVHRPIFYAQGGLFEYYLDLESLISEAGVTGKVGDFKLVNNGIEIFADRIQLIVRSPLDRLGENVASSYKFIGDWPVRTDSATGDSARYKRICVIEHGE